ncbi:DUF3027 domain-containing protein [Arsenicicoccus piscis]|uniref:DUF3027 domain-containing protein n=1 Tax=Arsenicicoccus piscis TaxID=673954 RepID=UPI0030C73CC7
MAAVKADTTVLRAVDVAREAAESIAEPGLVGEHVTAVMDGERVATHYFACLHPGYPDWRWAITVARVARSKNVTVSETTLLPSATSVVAPEWVPYADRLAPGDLGPADVLPYIEQDPNLEPGFEATGDEDVDRMAQWELGLGRKRVLSAEGREVAAQRWYDGANGPDAPSTHAASEHCSSCGFWLPMAGALRHTFGVCANAWSPSDGRVVSLDHGCGAHSETDVEPAPAHRTDPPLVDDLAVEVEAGAVEAEVPVEPEAAAEAEVAVQPVEADVSLEAEAEPASAGEAVGDPASGEGREQGDDAEGHGEPEQLAAGDERGPEEERAAADDEQRAEQQPEGGADGASVADLGGHDSGGHAGR